MATEKTPQEKAQEKIDIQTALRNAGHFRQIAKDQSDAKAAQAEADDESGRTAMIATSVARARHFAAMEDFKSGNAAERAIALYRVKRAVADYALTEGRRANGELLPVVNAIPASVATSAQTDNAATEETAAQ